MKKKLILILGHSGFIGQYLTYEFLKHDWEVIGIARHTRIDKTRLLDVNVANLEEYLLDISDPANDAILKKLIEDRQCNILCNLAWDVTENCHYSLTSIDSQHNVLRIAKMFAECKLHSKKELICAGTNAEYRQYSAAPDITSCIDSLIDTGAPHTQSDIIPDSIYGTCKAATFSILHKLCSDVDIAFKWPRIFVAFGYGMRPSCFMPALIKAIKNNEQFNINNGAMYVNFTPVELVASDIYKLIANVPFEFISSINIAANKMLTTSDVAHIICDAMHVNFDTHININTLTAMHQKPSLRYHDAVIDSTSAYQCNPEEYIWQLAKTHSSCIIH